VIVQLTLNFSDLKDAKTKQKEFFMLSYGYKFKKCYFLIQNSVNADGQISANGDKLMHDAFNLIIRTYPDPSGKARAILICDMELKLQNENSEVERQIIKRFLQQLNELEKSCISSDLKASQEGGVYIEF